MAKIFITSALPYVNAVPHLGNIIGSTLSGDIISRFHRLIGNDVFYLCGSDDYGTASAIKAMQLKVSCEELCSKNNQMHKEVYDWFNIKFDVWGKTSNHKQTEITHEIFLGLYRNGFIEEKTMIQPHCEKCQIFLPDRYMKGICYHAECQGKNNIANGDQCDFCQKMIDVDKLIDPFCLLCKTKPTFKETDHLYLKLGDLTDKIETYLNSQTDLKSNVRAIATSWLKMGLNSRCITRDLDWGTLIPKGIDDTLDKYINAGKVFYVWFDAPIGYYSILATVKPDWQEFLTNPNLQWISTQGKDNIPFHTIIFPGSILGSSAKYPLINQIAGTNYLLFEGQKFSKSNNIGIFGDRVMEISKELNINEDYWRFYLAKIRPETGDSSFSLVDFVQTVKTDLIGNIGNFINRCFCLAKQCSIKQMIIEPCEDLHNMYSNYKDHMQKFELRNGLKLCLQMSTYGNVCFETYKPWQLAKTDLSKVKDVIAKVFGICWILLNVLTPFIPKTSEKLLSAIHSNTKFTDVFQENTNFSKEIILEIIGEIELPFKHIQLDNIKKLL